jgi:hypothetical protein
MITTRRIKAPMKNPFKPAIHALVGGGAGAASTIYYNKTKRYRTSSEGTVTALHGGK